MKPKTTLSGDEHERIGKQLSIMAYALHEARCRVVESYGADDETVEVLRNTVLALEQARAVLSEKLAVEQSGDAELTYYQPIIEYVIDSRSDFSEGDDD